jgi:hypothetical protein
MVAPGPAPEPAHAASAIAHVTRDPAAANGDLEVVVRGHAAGAPLPRLTIHLPRGVNDLSFPVEPRYTAATFEIVDVSPFPVACEGGCVRAD